MDLKVMVLCSEFAHQYSKLKMLQQTILPKLFFFFGGGAATPNCVQGSFYNGSGDSLGAGDEILLNCKQGKFLTTVLYFQPLVLREKKGNYIFTNL